MDAKELMLGDYIYNLYGDKAIVRKLEDYNEHAKASGACIELVEGPEEGKTFCLYGQIEPIPLTPEILKKNGFENRGAQFFCDSIGMIWWKDNIFMFSKYTRHEDLPTENISINIGYVHELQHALRLAGIKKEIVL